MYAMKERTEKRAEHPPRPQRDRECPRSPILRHPFERCPILRPDGGSLKRLSAKHDETKEDAMTTPVRVNADNNWAILKDIILRNTAASFGSYPTPIKGFLFHRQVSNADPKPHFSEPVIIVVVQGKKLVRIGLEDRLYGENVCFVAGVDMPIASCVMEAREDRPYLSLSLYLDAGLIAALASQVPPSAEGVGAFRGAGTHTLEPDLLDSFVRLAELAEKPEQVPVMEALLLREIHYRLLIGPFGGALRTLNTFGSQGHQITRAIAWLKENYKEPLLVEDLASQSNMAPSTFHKYFKEITTLSPLQYQKRLRLGEARRLMLSEGYDVTQAAMSVGYESATQFIREYKRLYGEPPRRNIMAIKNMAAGEAGWVAM